MNETKLLLSSQDPPFGYSVYPNGPRCIKWLNGSISSETQEYSNLYSLVWIYPTSLFRKGWEGGGTTNADFRKPWEQLFMRRKQFNWKLFRVRLVDYSELPGHCFLKDVESLNFSSESFSVLWAARNYRQLHYNREAADFSAKLSARPR